MNIGGEDHFLAEALPLLPQTPDTIVGPGDDCAVIAGNGAVRLLTVDQVVAGIHFAVPDTSPAQVAVKLLRRNLSDIAAMGGAPRLGLLTIAAGPAFFAPYQIPAREWLLAFYRALGAEAARWGVGICGGDLSSAPDAFFAATLSLEGQGPAGGPPLRSGARPGQILLATGSFGNSFPSGHHLDFTPRLAEGAFLAAAAAAAMIDVSDGLVKDASRLARASGLAIQITPGDVPRRAGASLAAALADGEDYELLCAAPPAVAARIESSWPFDTPLTRIGKTLTGPPGQVSDPAGAEIRDNGFDHGRAGGR